MFRTGIIADSLSLASYYLEMIPDGTDNVLAVGTGFFYEYQGDLYLITNGHNVTRLNPETNERICSSLAFPAKIKLKVRSIVAGEVSAYATQNTYIDLYDDEEFTKPKWFVHPNFGYRVDVVAIPVCQMSEISSHLKLIPINHFEYDGDFLLEVADEVFVLGFPFAITGGKNLPIWKKGSVATEPGIDLDDLPKLLIDTATRQGMSGTPVIAKRTGIHGFNKDGTYSPNAAIGTLTGFIGVYSGRIGGNDHMHAQLGVVWKKHVIEQIIQGKCRGDIKFQNV